MKLKPIGWLYKLADFNSLTMFFFGWFGVQLVINSDKHTVLWHVVVITSMILELLLTVGGIWYRHWCRTYWTRRPWERPAY